MSQLVPLIVSTEPLLRLGLQHFLKDHQMPLCLLAESAVDALRLSAEHAPGLVIIAVAEGRVDVPRLVRDLRRRRRELPVLVICRALDAGLVSACLESGGCAWITSEDVLAEVGVACASVLRGDLHVSRRLARVLPGAVKAQRAAGARAAGRPGAGLSAREQTVFTLVAGGFGCKEIAGKMGISVKTVETHQQRMKVKLGLACNSELRRRAQGG